MTFRLAVVGHRSSIDEIQQIIATKFENVDTTGVELANDEMTDDAVQTLKALLPHLDGVLYTRDDPYKLVVSRLDHAGVPARYVSVDGASFLQALLIAKLHYHSDIFHVSVDTLEYNTVINSYGSLEISTEEVHPVMVQVDTHAEHFVEATTQAHVESYRNGLCSVCITNIRSVLDTLSARNIPCVLMTPSPDNYINEIRRLLLQWDEGRNDTDNTCMIRIRAELSGDYYLHRKTMVQNVLDVNNLAEAIVMFAQRVNGAYMPMGEQDFAIACSFDTLSDATENFSQFPLLAQAYTNTPYRLSIGIGTGINHQIALMNADLGTHRAWAEGGNRAYLVHAENSLIGPIQPNELLHAHRIQINHKLTKAAQDCSMSINTITKIDTFARRKNNGSFITAELVDELHVSFRTAARIVEKMEKHGYLVEIGRSAINGRGRPTRVFRLLW